MRFVLWMLLSLLLLAFLAAGTSVYLYKNTRNTQAVTIIIEPRTGTRAILTQLHDAGLVPSVPLMVIPVLMTADYHALKAGEYAFAAGMTPAQIIGKIIRGEVVVHKITIPEGWTSYQVREALMKEPLLVGEVPAFAEGSLLPDTMHFRRGETRVNVIKRMQEAQYAWFDSSWDNCHPDLPIKTTQEVLILASIVEKETGELDERAMVAGVFHNRLRLGMPLQSDPTVVYGIEAAQGGKPMGRALSRADLKADTPYNTYTRKGLPPTPISNPGEKAIDAVLMPAKTDALYFVATGTGGHRFAATLKEHNTNVAEYRKVMAGQGN